MDTYTFWSLLLSTLSHYFFSARLPLSLKHTYFFRFLLSLGGFGHFSIRWSSDPHIKHLQGVRSVRLFSKSPAARAFFLFFLILFKKNLNNFWHLHKKCTLYGQDLLSHYFYHNLNCCQDLYSQSIRMK